MVGEFDRKSSGRVIYSNSEFVLPFVGIKQRGCIFQEPAKKVEVFDIFLPERVFQALHTSGYTCNL